MAAHNTNSLLKYMLPLALLLLVVVLIAGHRSSKAPAAHPHNETKNSASIDSAAESLDTLTAELAATQQKINQVAQANATLQQQNASLTQQAQGAQQATTAALTAQMAQLKNQLQQLKTSPPTTGDYLVNAHGVVPITTVADLTESNPAAKPFSWLGATQTPANASQDEQPTLTSTPPDDNPPKPIPYYTIPANATAVQNKLMTALVGRIPVKGVVTDPYPFKIVFADDTLAANGWRVPHLRQMVVSGYTEGDLNLVSVRGWVTSLTFVFDDGTIATTTSNNNDVGHFTKENALGYLSDPQGNPFIRGKLITNAPTYLGVNVALGAAQGAANAYAQAQTTTQSTVMGTNTAAVTGSPGAYVAGQAAGNAAAQVQQWWHDREENSFDAVYVPAGGFIVVNFAKEIPIDYNPQGRKIDHAITHHRLTVSRTLD